ncbi:MAG: anti-sigma factor family protein [Gemmatimonadales bacterium]
MSNPMPITCEEALRLLAAYLDEELHAGEHECVERHLELCRGCYSRAEFERRLKAEINRLGREDIPPSFEQRVRRLLDSFVRSPEGKPADHPRI